MQPQCGFSYKVLSMLNEVGANYEVLDVLDEQYNPGLREAIKEYSQWPTIPQVTRYCAISMSQMCRQDCCDQSAVSLYVFPSLHMQQHAAQCCIFRDGNAQGKCSRGRIPVLLDGHLNDV